MILGVESSCDDSSLALMDFDFSLKFYKKISQESEHSKFGGVVPELAARLHTQALPNLLQEIKPNFHKIKAVAVVNEPGLSVSLVGGISLAKALAISLNLPLISINHLIGHIYSLFLSSEITLPLGVLLISGGHTMVLEVDENRQINILAQTSDDSLGESFDKVAKMMGLGYPGGALIENLAKNGNSDKFDFTIPLRGDKRAIYSFSGLKNQARLAIENLQNEGKFDKEAMCDLAASFQKTATLHILDRLKMVVQGRNFTNFGVVGGASANLFIRSHLQEFCKNHNLNLITADLEFCSDNAAMIARAGISKYKRGEFCDINELKIQPRVSLQGSFI